jgi:F-type H+-transporting ATPase subunit a
MLTKFSRFLVVFSLLAVLGSFTPLLAQEHGAEAPVPPDAATNSAPRVQAAAESAHHDGESPGAGEHAGEHSGGHGKVKKDPSPFAPHQGSWFNPVARLFSGNPALEPHTDEKGELHFNPDAIRYDYVVATIFCMLLLAGLWIVAARRMKLRPEGKASSLPNSAEAALEGFYNYLVAVMGEPLAKKYVSLIASFFFTILILNWISLIPGMVKPTANPNVTIGLALVAFFAVHFIAIREVGFKSYIMHFVGEPVWLAPLNFPLHIIGELIKPLSLSLRLLCNMFGEEMVVSVFTLMATAIAINVAGFDIPFLPIQLPFMALGLFFGALQALVFSTLLAIYIAVLSTHHDDHDEHNAHGHVEHPDSHGPHHYVGRPNQSTVGA